MGMKKAIWIHGGPGFNSFHEAQILNRDALDAGFEVTFWNEPSKNRPFENQNNDKNAFLGWKKSLEKCFLEILATTSAQKITIIAHSFGSLGAIHLLEKFENSIEEIFLITPSLNLGSGFRSIARLAAKNFSQKEPEKSKEILKLIQETNLPYDQNIKTALELSLTDAELLLHYWVNKEKMLSWLQSYSKPETALDLDSFWSVLDSMDFSNLLPNRKFDVPCSALFGERDPVSSEKDEYIFLHQLFNDLSVSEMKEVAHYPHFEKPKEFISHFLMKVESSALANLKRRSRPLDHLGCVNDH